MHYLAGSAARHPAAGILLLRLLAAYLATNGWPCQWAAHLAVVLHCVDASCKRNTYGVQRHLQLQQQQ